MANRKNGKTRMATSVGTKAATGLIVGAMVFISFAVVGGLFAGMFMKGIMGYQESDRKVEKRVKIVRPVKTTKPAKSVIKQPGLKESVGLQGFNVQAASFKKEL